MLNVLQLFIKNELVYTKIEVAQIRQVQRKDFQICFMLCCVKENASICSNSNAQFFWNGNVLLYFLEI